MHAAFRTVNGRPLSLTIPFEDFLASGEMRRQALVNLCSPEDLVLDHLPAFDPDDDDEKAKAFGKDGILELVQVRAGVQDVGGG